jgi:ATP-dependent Clp protease ATP-binding subunit ClpC
MRLMMRLVKPSENSLETITRTLRRTKAPLRINLVKSTKRRTHFRPDFLNRIDDTIIFDRLEKDDIKQIITLQLDRGRTRLAKQSLGLVISEEVKDIVSTEGYDPGYGARPIKRAIQRLLLDGEFTEGDTITTSIVDDQIIFEREMNETTHKE